jgi:alpha-L-rhamnosidase
MTTTMFSRNFLRVITCLFACGGVASAAPVHLVDEKPVASKVLADGSLWIDFGRVSFGNLRVTMPAGDQTRMRFHFGEKSADGRVDRKPPGTVRYAVADVTPKSGESFVVAPPADKRNTSHKSAILTPPEWGVVLPFRWVEIEGWPSGAGADGIIRQSAFASTWDDKAASFSSSDETLDRIWELCRYSIKATTFAGVYVDGDRERIPYEADAYLNQISHYYTDRDIQMARDTYDQLMKHPTWPTEWAPHMVFMAHADWMHTGDAEWLKPRYEALKTKLLIERAGADGLIRSNEEQKKKTDIVDWPMKERDGYVFCEINTVVNAFHLAALSRMADIARAVGKMDEAEEYTARFHKTHSAFQAQLYMREKHAYRDGVGTDHASSHASLFPLAFDLVPEPDRKLVAGVLAERGMRCSVYAAQYLMEALFRNGHDKEAMQLILADGDRSWKHMVNSGTTISWEAWDQKYKPNQDWNHAWGAAPANLLPRFVLGVEASGTGWQTARISPRTSGLKHARGTIPTPRGTIDVAWMNHDAFEISVTLPQGIEANIDLPSMNTKDQVWVNDRMMESTRMGNRLVVTKPLKGSFRMVVR